MADPLLCEGRVVRLRPVQADDFPAIARLRNAARDFFLDSREVTADGVAAWLGSMRFPDEALLRIESPTGVFLGVTGWNHLCMNRREAEIGRLMVDLATVLREVPRARPSVAVDAVRAVGRYLFLELGLERVLTSYIASNRYAAKVNERCGMVPVRTSEHVRADGSVLEVVHLELTIQRWISLQDSYARQ
jgi:RimJ/RimL family protein N-acetyltransferase